MNNLFIDKYRPYYLKDFIPENVDNIEKCSHMNNIKNTLTTLLQMNDLNILFIGPTGSGKTSLLNAMIREYYGLSKNDIFSESNILFINNLKEQGINYYRNEMKTFCQSHSSIYGKKKMLVIDDIDYINEQSQQVFRNYIDKYKNNIHFICSCSNIQKVIESIQSRVHIIRMHNASLYTIEQKMNEIIEKENLLLEPETKSYLLENSKFSIRVLIHNLEKLCILNSNTYISLKTYKQICENISFQHFEEYLESIIKNDLQSAIHVIYNIYDYGYSVIDILDYFFSFIKSTNMIDDGMKYKIIPFLCKYITVFHNVHEDGIELSFFTNQLLELFLLK